MTPALVTHPLVTHPLVTHPLMTYALVSCLGWVLGSLAVPAGAQTPYKIIGADGKVTYTDRAPGPSDGRVTTLGARPPPVVEVALPLELRQATTRYPVTLYLATANCEPCDAARQLLRQRGVPYSEKQIVSAEDSEALERLSGGRDAPTLSIGSQVLRGLAPEVWTSYLDAAGYPRESRLPANYQYAAATPVAERRDATAAVRATPAASRAASAAEAATAGPAPAASGIIKF